MNYELVYTRRAERDIKKLDQTAKKRLGDILLRYREDPLKFAEKLTDPALGSYRFRSDRHLQGWAQERHLQEKVRKQALRWVKKRGGPKPSPLLLP